MNVTTIKRAQKCGYLVGEYKNIESTLCYKFFDAFATCHVAYEILSELVGNEATWDDLTDDNLCIYAKVIKSRYAPITAIDYFAHLKALILADIDKVPAKNFREYFKVKTDSNSYIILDDETIKLIDSYECKSPGCRYAKNIFMRMILTGARLSDAITFTMENVSMEKKTLFYNSKIANMDICIPVYPMLYKYLNEAIPEKEQNQKHQAWNVRLKNLLAKVGLPDYIIRQTNYMTAIRTFATRLYWKGVDADDIGTMIGVNTPRHYKNLIAGYKKKGTKTVLSKIFEEL